MTSNKRDKMNGIKILLPIACCAIVVGCDLNFPDNEIKWGRGPSTQTTMLIYDDMIAEEIRDHKSGNQNRNYWNNYWKGVFEWLGKKDSRNDTQELTEYIISRRNQADLPRIK